MYYRVRVPSQSRAVTHDAKVVTSEFSFISLPNVYTILIFAIFFHLIYFRKKSFAVRMCLCYTSPIIHRNPLAIIWGPFNFISTCALFLSRSLLLSIKCYHFGFQFKLPSKKQRQRYGLSVTADRPTKDSNMSKKCR